MSAGRDLVETAGADGLGTDELEADETVIVARRALPTESGDAAAADAAGVADPDSDETVVVARRAPAADAAADAEVDQTVVVERTAVRATPLPTDAPDAVMHAPTRRSRRPAPAPVSDEVLRTATHGAGPGLLEHYDARPEIATAPAPRPAIAAGAAPTRDPAQALPSVARRSRRSAVAVLAAFATSCVLAAAGLVVVAVLALAELFG